MPQARITLTIGDRTVVIERLTTAQFLALTALESFSAESDIPPHRLLMEMSALVAPFTGETAAEAMTWPIDQLCDVFAQVLTTCKGVFAQMINEQVTPAINALTARLQALAEG